MIYLEITNEKIIFENLSLEKVPTIIELYSKIEDFSDAIGFFSDMSTEEINAEFKHILDDQNSFYCLIRDNNSALLGFIKGTLIKEKNLLWINSFGIVPWQRKKSLGTKIFQIVVGYFKLLFDVNEVFLSVRENNLRAMNFWSKNKFVIVSDKKKYLSFLDKSYSVVIMSKKV